MIKFVLKNITIESDLKENLNVVQQQYDFIFLTSSLASTLAKCHF